MVEYKQITFMPWAGQSEIRFGNIIFWPYDRNAINNEMIKNHLDKLFDCYVDITGEKVNSITIASFKDKNYFEPLTGLEYAEMKETRDILCFISITSQTRSSVGMNNKSIVPPSAEIFQMVYQNFIPGSYDFAYKAGNVLSGGWTLDEIHFSKPLSTGGLFQSRNKTLNQAFSKIIKLPIDESNRIRILRTMEWFRLAHVESDEVSILSRVVMMSTAFEILLNFPQMAKSEYFLDRIENLLPSINFKSEKRTYKKSTKEASLAGWWAWDFYKLRNSIVHGNMVNSQTLVYKSWFTQLIVADLVLMKLISLEFKQLGFIQDKDSFIDVYNLLGWQ